jgi:uncharacterized protein (DUF924 family)
MVLHQPYRDVLEYWFGEDQASPWPAAAVSRRWFLDNAAQDADIAERFGERVEAALRRDLVEWERQPDTRLALIVLLDQFTRNMFRGERRAFDGDHRAATLTLEGLSTGMERHLPWAGQVFFCMPLMHAEDLELQERGVACFRTLQKRAPAALREHIGQSLRFAEEHRDVIARFGRFPHRNRALGRDSSAEELAYLEHGNRYGQ